MVGVDFSNFEEAKAYFEEQSPERRCLMASRAALRVVATLGLFGAVPKESLALASLRAILTVAGRGLGRPADVDELETAANSARLAANAAHNASHAAADTAGSGRSAAISTTILATTSAAHSAQSAAGSAEHSAQSVGESAIDSANQTAAYSAAISAVLADANMSDEALLQTALWPDAPPASILRLHDTWVAFLEQDPDWAFWLRWYSQMWDGTFRDWDLAIEVAKIPAETWEGVDALAKVAEEIRGIEARQALGPAIRDLRENETRVSSDSFLPSRGHNNPPELIDEPKLATRVELVWAALDTLAHETEANEPDLSKARKALVVVRDWFFAACAYVGRKADLVIDTTIKWGIPVLGSGYLVAHPDKLQKIIELAEIWLKP